MTVLFFRNSRNREGCCMKARARRITAGLLLVVSLLGWSTAQATGQSEPVKISNDWVVVHLVRGVDIPLDVQAAFLEGVTDCIRYVEGFFGSCLPKRVQYVFTESGRFLASAMARPPFEIIDEMGVPRTVEEAEHRCAWAVLHELVHLHSYGTWGDYSFASVSEGFAEFVPMLRAQYPLHDAAAAFHKMGSLPTLRDLLTMPPSNLVYSCMPSFLGFVYEEFGYDALISIYNNIPPYTESRPTEKLLALIEGSTATPLDELESKWHKMLDAREMSERLAATIKLSDELRGVDMIRLRRLSEYLGVEIDATFREELQSIVTDIRRYGLGEPIGREKLSERITRLSEWAEEICDAMVGISR